MRVHPALVVGVLLVATLVAPGESHAQGLPRPRPEPQLRADLIAGSRPAVQVGAGVQVPAGVYMRVSLDAAAGPRLGHTDASSRLDGRVDLLARFLLDPFRQTAWGISAGGGLTARVEPGDRVRPLLLVALDLEGRRSARGFAPAVQLGLGGGVRLGVVLRRAGATR